ncbi:MAG: hypothetical protein HYX76_11670 [Acidobacteria bacterium]|nr:hypothetical protein [Acidobacteriota bacterium]
MTSPHGTIARCAPEEALLDAPARVSPERVCRAIREAVAYADVFDYPLTVAEVHRYLGVSTPVGDINAILGNGYLVPLRLSRQDGYFTLPGREQTIETRRRRAAVAERVWPTAVRYGRALSALPFARMVAVTGALAIDNVDETADIDYLVVTETGRLWTCRALAIALVRWARTRGVELCPNYFLSDRALLLGERSLFIAHEIAQMVPLSGRRVYEQLRWLNGWADELLPNASGPARALWHDRPSRLARVGEPVLRGRLASSFERWEMRRKVRKFAARAGASAETAFSADRCKGHFAAHGRRILDAYLERLRQLEE